MIRTLQKKFVVTAMIAITALLLLLLGAINLANIILGGKVIDHTLQMIAGQAVGQEGLPQAPRDLPPRIFTQAPKNDHDMLLSSNFFIVLFSTEGTVIQTDTSRISSVSEQQAEALARAAYENGAAGGQSGNFRYLLRSDSSQTITCAVFLDISEEIFSYLRILLLSASAGLVCWGLMLGLVILLSQRAIRPIAESLEKQKQFVTNAGHEIKTPLAIIRSNTEAMELYCGENRWSRNIKQQTARLTGLMERLLWLARMEEGALHAKTTEFSLSRLLSDLLQGFMQPMEEKQIALETQIQPDICLRADSGQIEQLISVLLDNAVKYTDEQGWIRVKLQKEGRQVLLQIANSCRELPDAPPDKLFDRFYRADAARTQKNGGYGIGLSIASAIASANRGHIHAAYLGTNAIRFTVIF